MDRIDVEIKLHRGRAEALEAIAAMSEEERNEPRTRSEDNPDSWWTNADHFIHTTLIEKNFNEMIRRHVRGETAMAAQMVGEPGGTRPSVTDIMSYVHRMTEAWKVEQEGKPLDELVKIGLAVRADTLLLLNELTDEQLASRVPGAPWGDGTVAGIMAVHTDHFHQHQTWAAEGTPAT